MIALGLDRIGCALQNKNRTRDTLYFHFKTIDTLYFLTWSDIIFFCSIRYFPFYVLAHDRDVAPLPHPVDR